MKFVSNTKSTVGVCARRSLLLTALLLVSCSAFNAVSDAPEQRDGAIAAAPDAAGHGGDMKSGASTPPKANGRDAGGSRHTAGGTGGSAAEAPMRDETAGTIAVEPAMDGSTVPVEVIDSAVADSGAAPDTGVAPDSGPPFVDDDGGACDDAGDSCGCEPGFDLIAGKCRVHDKCQLDDDGSCGFPARCVPHESGNRCECPRYYRDERADGSSCVDYRVLSVEGYGGNDFTLGYGLAKDSLGNLFLSGAFSWMTSFGELTQNSAGSFDAYVTKFDPSGAGEPLWGRRFGSTGDDRGFHLAVDSHDDLLMIGSVESATAFDQYTVGSAGFSGFVVKLASDDGSVKWVRTLPGAGNYDNVESFAWDVAVDSLDNVYVLGEFAGTFDFGTADGPLTPSGWVDAFLIKYSSDGSPQWVRTLGTAEKTAGVAIAVDHQDNVIVTGLLSGELAFAHGPEAGFGGEDGFVIALSPSGTRLWSTRFGAGKNDRGTALAIGEDDSVYLAGAYEGELTFQDQALPEGPALSLFVAHLDSDGELDWIKGAPSGSGVLSAHALVKLPDSLLVAGDFSVSLDFEDGTQLRSQPDEQNRYPEDMYVARFALEGKLKWAQRFGGTNYDEIRDAIADDDGNLRATGWFHGPVTFGTEVLYTPEGWFKAPLLRIQP